jgi:hypothetical protein
VEPISANAASIEMASVNATEEKSGIRLMTGLSPGIALKVALL